MGTTSEGLAPSPQDTAGGDHVRESSPDTAVEMLDRQLRDRVARYEHASRADLDERISELEREWDIERVLELNASALALTGVALAAGHDRRWLWLSGGVLSFLIQHAVQGWCPPIEVFRRMGVRTRSEIEAERHALKAIRGDYRELSR
jgi:hypothetical protein